MQQRGGAPLTSEHGKLSALQTQGNLIMQCEHCKEGIPQLSISAITVTIDCYVKADSGIVNLCCWECAAMWFNATAGEILMAVRSHRQEKRK
jgi:hypothetical protein